jgi:hypothetical protein
MAIAKIYLDFNTDQIDPIIAKNSIEDLTKDWKWVKRVEVVVVK